MCALRLSAPPVQLTQLSSRYKAPLSAMITLERSHAACWAVKVTFAGSLFGRYMYIL